MKRPRSLRSGSRNGVRHLPANESGIVGKLSPAMVREAHARGSRLACQHILPSAVAGRSDCSSEDGASRGRSSKSRGQTRCRDASAKREFQDEPR